MKTKAFLITKKEFIKNNKLICDENADKNSILTFDLLKKEAKIRFVKKNKAKDWNALKKQGWTIKKVTIEIK